MLERGYMASRKAKVRIKLPLGGTPLLSDFYLNNGVYGKYGAPPQPKFSFDKISDKDVVEILAPGAKCSYSEERKRFEIVSGHIIGVGSTENEAWTDARNIGSRD
jgi:hypothetical protein